MRKMLRDLLAQMVQMDNKFDTMQSSMKCIIR